MKDSLLFKKVYGAIMGSAVGDGLGAPFEEMNYFDIQKHFGWITDMHPSTWRVLKGARNPYHDIHMYEPGPTRVEWTDPHPFGQWTFGAGAWTDDTRYRILVYRAILEKGRRISSKEFAEFLNEYVQESRSLPESSRQRLWATDMFKFSVLADVAHSPVPFAALFEIITGWGGPAGILHAFDPYEAARDGGVTAAAVAEALKPDATVESIIEAARSSYWTLPGSYSVFGLGFLQNEYCKRIDEILAKADKASDVHEFIESIYEDNLITYSPWNLLYPLEIVPVALGMFYFYKGDYKQTVLGCVNFGRDNETIAAIAGEMAGAFQGIDAVPAEWLQLVKEENKEQADLELIAEQMCELLLKRRECLQQKLDCFDQLA